MISLQTLPTSTQFHISAPARAAIAEGVLRDDPVAELEYLGLTVRTLNILENSQFRITKLSELLSRTREELLEIPNVTPSVLREILDAVAHYNELEEAKQILEEPVAERRDAIVKQPR